jgi:hypothetical protein
MLALFVWIEMARWICLSALWATEGMADGEWASLVWFVRLPGIGDGGDNF